VLPTENLTSDGFFRNIALTTLDNICITMIALLMLLVSAKAQDLMFYRYSSISIDKIAQQNSNIHWKEQFLH
jgi:hypothetical protein